MTKTLTAFALVILSAQLCSATMVIRRFGSVGPPPDLSAKFVAWWDLDDAANGNRVASGGTCPGTDCTLTDGATSVGLDTTNKIVGTGAADFGGNASGDYLKCADATCDELDGDGATDFTWGCWARIPSTGGGSENKRMFDNRNNNLGYEIQYRTSSDALRCITNGNNTTTANSTWVNDNSFHHIACVYDDSAGTLQPMIDGATSGSAGTGKSLSSDSVDFELSNPSGAQEFYGQLDECFVAKRALTAGQLCHIISCGIDGPGENVCECDGATYNNDGRRATYGCSLSGINCDNPIP